MPARIKVRRCECGAKVIESTVIGGKCVACRATLPEAEDDLEVALARLRDDPTLEILLAKIREDKRLNVMLAEMAHDVRF
jgi:hypothetical protein